MESKSTTDILREEYEKLKTKYREMYINYHSLENETETKQKGVFMKLLSTMNNKEILSSMPLAEIPAHVFDAMGLFDGYADVDFAEVVTKVYNSTLNEIGLFLDVLLETYEISQKQDQLDEEVDTEDEDENEECSDSKTLFSYLGCLDK